jgi:hypothetical protein
VLLVHAKHEAAKSWYMQYSFEESPTDPLHLMIHALRTYFGPPVGPIGRYIRRPPTSAELDREVERLRSRR